MTQLEIRLIGQGAPVPEETAPDTPNAGLHSRLHIGVQRRSEVVDVMPGNVPRVAFRLSVDVISTDDGELDIRGPYVHGPRGDRFLYLSWGAVDQGGAFDMVKRMKIKLGPVDCDLIGRTLQTGAVLQGAFPLTDRAGNPSSGTVRPDLITWTLIPDADRA